MGKEAVVIANGAAPEGLIVSDIVTVVDCAGTAESVTENISETALAEAVGVPPIVPVDALSVRPAGSEPEVTDQL